MPDTGRSDDVRETIAGKKIWTAEEKAYLKAHYYSCSVDDMSTHLNKSKKAVRAMAHYLGVTNGHSRCSKLSEKEKAYVRQHAVDMSINQIAKSIRRNNSTIKHFMQSESLGVYAKSGFRCNPPDSCFACPYDDCVCCKCNNTPKEAEFLRIGMERTVGEGTVVRKRV